jgi:hypothetical protein
MSSAWCYLSSHEPSMMVIVVTWAVHDVTCRHMSLAWWYLSSHEQYMMTPVITWAVHDVTCRHMSSAWWCGTLSWLVRTESDQAVYWGDSPGHAAGSTCNIILWNSILRNATDFFSSQMTSYEHEPIPNGFMQTAYGCFKAGKLHLEKSAVSKGAILHWVKTFL